MHVGECGRHWCKAAACTAGPREKFILRRGCRRTHKRIACQNRAAAKVEGKNSSSGLGSGKDVRRRGTHVITVFHFVKVGLRGRFTAWNIASLTPLQLSQLMMSSGVLALYLLTANEFDPIRSTANETFVIIGSFIESTGQALTTKQVGKQIVEYRGRSTVSICAATITI
jgi:hypothetical protein